MVVRVGDVLDGIDRRAPFRKAAAWDAVGLQLGDLDRPVSVAGVAHELTGPVVDEILARGFDLVVTYHPLVFRPLRSVTAVAGPEGRSFALVEGGVSVISVHTNWDVAAGGAADSLAAALRIENLEGFGVADTADGEPVRIGRLGTFGGTPTDLLRTVRTALRARPRAAGLGGRRVRRVAVAPGSGGAHVDDAISAGADAYVTGDVSHHEARRAVDHRMAVIDAGHGPTERPGVRALHSLVTEVVQSPVELVGVDDNPWEVGWNG